MQTDSQRSLSCLHQSSLLLDQFVSLYEKNKNLFDRSGRRREKNKRAVFLCVVKKFLNLDFCAKSQIERGLKAEPICVCFIK
jgi:hypothetical protein